MSAAAQNRVLLAAVFALGVACAIGLLHIVSVIGAIVPFDPNEGWNAYYASAAMASGSPYPPLQSFMTNNYPPLSFYLVGASGRALGDVIVAGRLVSLAAFLALAGGIALALRMMACRALEAAFGAQVFASCLLLNSNYVGMDDPQLLGHAVAMGGLLLLLQQRRDLPTLAMAALLFTLGFFVKHNLIVLPLAITAWLAIYDRRYALRFAIAGAALFAIGLIVFRLTYGFGLLSRLQSARLFAFHDLGVNLWSWLIWGLLPLAIAGSLLVLRRNDKYVVLCAIYAFAAFLVGASFFGGAGVDVNAMFDVDIALSLIAGLALNRFSGRSVLFAGAAAAFLLPLAMGLYLAFDRNWLDRDFWLHPMRDETTMAGQDIDFLRAHRGPALCETLAYCYWAGKPPEVDVFNTGQQFATHARRDDVLVQQIDARHFATLQFDTLSPFALGDDVRKAVDRAYRVEHTNDDGVFLVPR